MTLSHFDHALRPTRLLLGASALAAAQWAQAVVVQELKPLSAPGQPLRAELTLTDVSAEDLRSLQVSISPPEAYQAIQLQRSPALAQVQVRLQPLGNNTVRVDLLSNTPAQAAELDILLDVRWANGRISPHFNLSLSDNGALPARPVTVIQGDTLSELMIAHRYGVGSMAQRLVATQRINPQAFIRDNVNLVRAGAVLRMPSRDEILSIDAREAKRLIDIQMAAFDAYRRGLASQARAVNEAPQKQEGTVEAAVKATADGPSGDRLTLSNGNLVSPGVSPEAIAAAKTREATQLEQGELAANIQDLQALAESVKQASAGSTSAPTQAVGAITSPNASAATTTAGAAPNGSAGVTAPSPQAAPAPAAEPSTGTGTAQDAIGATPAAATEAGPANAVAAADSPAQTAAPRLHSPAKLGGSEPQWVTQMRRQPWLLPLVGLLLVALAAGVWLRRKRQAQADDAEPADTEAAVTAEAQAPAEPSPPPCAQGRDAQAEAAATPAPAEPVTLQPVSAGMPDVDLELPDLPLTEPDTAADSTDPTAPAALLEQAKAKLRQGDVAGARALAEVALHSGDPMIQANAKAFLERL